MRWMWTATTSRRIGKGFEARSGAALTGPAAPVVEHPPSVVLVVREGEDVVLVRQHRPGANGPVVELPAGKVEPGESTIEAAERELAEECSLAADGWRVLGSFWAAPAYSTERVTVLSANVSGPAEAAAHADEAIHAMR